MKPLRVAVMVNLASDYRIRYRAAPPRAHFFLGQVFQLLERLSWKYDVSVDIISRHGILTDHIDEYTPVWYFVDELRNHKIKFNRLCALNSCESKYDILMMAFQYKGATRSEKIIHLLRSCSRVVYLESDGELFRPVEMGFLLPVLLLDPNLSDIKSKMWIFSTLVHGDYYKFMKSVHHQTSYLPSVPLENYPTFENQRKYDVVHIRVLNEGCLAELAGIISTPIAEQRKSVSSFIAEPLPDLWRKISLGRCLMPGTCAHNPPAPMGFRLTSKTWEASLAGALCLFPVCDLSHFRLMFKTYPKELTIPIYMDSNAIEKWVDEFRRCLHSLSDDDVKSLIREQSWMNSLKNSEVIDMFSSAAEKIIP